MIQDENLQKALKEYFDWEEKIVPLEKRMKRFEQERLRRIEETFQEVKRGLEALSTGKITVKYSPRQYSISTTENTNP